VFSVNFARSVLKPVPLRVLCVFAISASIRFGFFGVSQAGFPSAHARVYRTNEILRFSYLPLSTYDSRYYDAPVVNWWDEADNECSSAMSACTTSPEDTIFGIGAGPERRSQGVAIPQEDEGSHAVTPEAHGPHQRRIYREVAPIVGEDHASRLGFFSPNPLPRREGVGVEPLAAPVQNQRWRRKTPWPICQRSSGK
jgi:hypothetical protein